MSEQRFKPGDRIRSNEDYEHKFNESYTGTILVVRSGITGDPIFYDYKVRLDGISEFFGYFNDDEVEAIDE